VLLQLRGSNFKTWVDHSSSLNKSYVNFMLKRTRGMIVLGNNLKYLFKDYYADDNIFVVPNGGNYTIPKRKESEELKILYLSNLLASKGVEDVFKAIEILTEEMEAGYKGREKPKFSIDFIGSWQNEQDKNTCLAIKEKNKLPIRIHSPKGLAEKFQYLADADIFVFPPRDPEGHPWSIVEAMAAGLPVISTDRGAIIESVIQNKNGFIVEPNHPEQIAEKLKLLLEDTALRKKMGLAGRELYLANFTEEKMVEKLSTVFTKIIAA
jgi:glycosyltransferase involved in cell wall biosynthesis